MESVLKRNGRNPDDILGLAKKKETSMHPSTLLESQNTNSLTLMNLQPLLNVI